MMSGTSGSRLKVRVPSTWAGVDKIFIDSFLKRFSGKPEQQRAVWERICWTLADFAYVDVVNDGQEGPFKFDAFVVCNQEAAHLYSDSAISYINDDLRNRDYFSLYCWVGSVLCLMETSASFAGNEQSSPPQVVAAAKTYTRFGLLIDDSRWGPMRLAREVYGTCTLPAWWRVARTRKEAALYLEALAGDDEVLSSVVVIEDRFVPDGLLWGAPQRWHNSDRLGTHRPNLSEGQGDNSATAVKRWFEVTAQSNESDRLWSKVRDEFLGWKDSEQAAEQKMCRSVSAIPVLLPPGSDLGSSWPTGQNLVVVVVGAWAVARTGLDSDGWFGWSDIATWPGMPSKIIDVGSANAKGRPFQRLFEKYEGEFGQFVRSRLDDIPLVIPLLANVFASRVGNDEETRRALYSLGSPPEQPSKPTIASLHAWSRRWVVGMASGGVGVDPPRPLVVGTSDQTSHDDVHLVFLGCHFARGTYAEMWSDALNKGLPTFCGWNVTGVTWVHPFDDGPEFKGPAKDYRVLRYRDHVVRYLMDLVRFPH